MYSRIRAAGPAGPARWLLAFLGARERAMRTHIGLASGPAEWLLVFLQVERAELTARRRAARPEQSRAPERSRATAQPPAPERIPGPVRTAAPVRSERAAPPPRRGRSAESSFGRLTARSA